MMPLEVSSDYASLCWLLLYDALRPEHEGCQDQLQAVRRLSRARLKSTEEWVSVVPVVSVTVSDAIYHWAHDHGKGHIAYHTDEQKFHVQSTPLFLLQE